MAKAARKTAASDGPKLTMPEFAAGDESAALASAGAENAAIQMVRVDSLKVAPGFNIRFQDTPKYKEVVERIKRSIMSEGFYPSKPLAGFVARENGEDVILVTDGHRRLAALKLAIKEGADVASVPVSIKPAGTSMVDLTVALSKENSGEPNTMAENAVLAKRLLKAGLSEVEIAERLDFTERYVQDMQILIAAPKGVRDLVKRDRIAGTTAVTLLRKFSKKENGAALAEAEMTRMAERAEARLLARGADPEEARQARASAKDSSEGTKTGRVAVVPGDEDLDEEPSGKMRAKVKLLKAHWAGHVGHRFELKEVRAFAKLFGDTDWYEADANGTHAVLTEPVEFKATISRAPAPPAAKPVRKLSKRAQAARDAAMEDEDLDEPLPGIDVTHGEPEAEETGLADAAAPDADAARELEHADL